MRILFPVKFSKLFAGINFSNCIKVHLYFDKCPILALYRPAVSMYMHKRQADFICVSFFYVLKAWIRIYHFSSVVKKTQAIINIEIIPYLPSRIILINFLFPPEKIKDKVMQIFK